MKDRRNATASWSGYSHQGKVGLYVVLRKLNQLSDFEDRKKYKLRYEQSEDFDIIDEMNQVIEIHQVKAKIGGKNQSVYKDALTYSKIVLSPNGLNYLHVITKITDWKDSIIFNPNNIILYIYQDNSKFCPLDNIDKLIDIQVKEILNKIKHVEKDNDKWREMIADNLKANIDTKIRDAHNKKTYKAVISFDEIFSIVVSGAEYSKLLIHSLREEFINQYLNFILELEENSIPYQKAHEILLNEECIKKIYMYKDNEFIIFLKNINPHTSKNIKLESLTNKDILKLLEGSNIKDVFFHCLNEVTKRKFNLDRFMLSYNKDAFEYVLTTISRPSTVASTVARDILNNHEVSSLFYEKTHIINEKLSGYLQDHAANLITYENEPTKEKFYDQKKLQFITSVDAIKDLNE